MSIEVYGIRFRQYQTICARTLPIYGAVMVSVVIAMPTDHGRAVSVGSQIRSSNRPSPLSDYEALIDLARYTHNWDVRIVAKPYFQCSSSKPSIRVLRQTFQEFKFCKSALKTVGDCDALLSWGDRIGFPASLMLNSGNLTHIIMSYDFKPKAKKIAYKYLRQLQRVDRFLVLTTAQKQFWEREIGISENSIDVVGGQVDITHFDPRYNHPVDDHLIVTAGVVYRDYPTLIRAVAGIPKVLGIYQFRITLQS